MVKLTKNKIYIVLLLVISFISHWYVFFDSGILNAGDWVFYFNSQLNDAAYNILYKTWANFGYITSSPNNWFFYFLSYLLSLSGLTWDISTRILFLFPIIFFTPLFAFLLFKKIFQNDLAAFFGACIYSFNTFFLKLQLDWITYAFIWWVLPALFLSIITYLETKKSKYLIYNAFLLFIGIVYEIRIMILVVVYLVLFLIVYLIFNRQKALEKLKDTLFVFISFFIGILLHSFWLLPIKIGGLSDAVMAYASPSVFVSFFDIKDVFTLHSYQWVSNLVLTPFIKQSIDLRHFLIPVLAVIGMIGFRKAFKNKRENIYVVFFGASLIIFVFLNKQCFAPFGDLYDWAFHNIPLFNLYRESSKFFIFTALSASFFYGVGLYYLYIVVKKYNIKTSILLIVVLLFFSSIFNLQHFFTQKIGGMTKGREIPEDYRILENYLAKDRNYYRILWLPTRTRFGYYSNSKPSVLMVNLIELYKNKADFSFKQLPKSEKLIYLLKRSYSDQMLDNFATKYIIIPSDEKIEIKEDINHSKWEWYIFRHYGGRENPNIRDWYISELDKVVWLQKIDIGTSELVVYENANYQPHIYSDSGLNYYQTNASEFGGFSKNQNLYLNSEIEKHEYLLSNLDKITVPIEADQDKIAEMKVAVDKTTEPSEKKKLQSDLDLYTSNLFFEDFKLKIPVGASYKIYLKIDSVLANNKDISIRIDNETLQRDEKGLDKEGWKYFNQIELGKGEHSLKLYVGNTPIDYINSGDIVLSAENLAEPIRTPQLEYKQINPTKYIVNVQGAIESFPLIFSENFHPGWKIYVQPAQNENLDGGKFYDLMFRKPVLADKHFTANNFANAWWVDLEELQRQGKITPSSDGTYDFSIVIEFEPQRFFYIGLFISGLTLISCLGYLIYSLRRWRKPKEA